MYDMISHQEILDIAEKYLTSYQKDVIEECLDKKRGGGLSLPMGFGKTLVSIVLGLKTSNQPFLVIMSKVLLSSWENEIKKFFGDKLKYLVFHKDANIDVDTFDFSNLDKTYHVVLTTPEVVSKFYTTHNLENLLVYKMRDPDNPLVERVFYNHINTNLLQNITRGGGFLFSNSWKCCIIDEAHKYTTVTSQRCRAISCIYSYSKWAMSGTLFDEPKVQKILGYYMIINDPDFPRNNSLACERISSDMYKGIQDTVVIRKNVPDFVKPDINSLIITTDMTTDERKIYEMIKIVLKKINKKTEEFKENNDNANVKKYSSYILAIITYLRQIIICPLIPISNIYLDTIDNSNKSDLSAIINDCIKTLGLESYFDNEESVFSSRFKKVVEVLNNHSKNNLVLFTSFRSCINVLKHFIPKERTIFVIEGDMSMNKRYRVIEESKKCENGILLLTYDIGAEGLNLQHCNTVLLLDLWWNDAKSQQAIARVVRRGQESKNVNIYYFTSNTCLENIILKKQIKKNEIIEKLNTGKVKLESIETISMKEVLKIISHEENIVLLNQLKI